MLKHVPKVSRPFIFSPTCPPSANAYLTLRLPPICPPLNLSLLHSPISFTLPSTPFPSSLQLQLLSPRTLESYPTTLLPTPPPGIHAPRRPWPEAQSANNEEGKRPRAHKEQRSLRNQADPRSPEYKTRPTHPLPPFPPSI